ncbi:MAG TPA: HD domain-containing protein [Smithellaceae bacterium]|nr:HD domain-containing protein [Smithellaceae bacterium]HRS89207.1 HD domain-containing protein [Smithellaceae bacterium]HRV26131.1 HD domain-containing protein [Smithellaceae bacterium]
MDKRFLKSKFNIDKELVNILLLIAIACFIYFFIINQRAFLNVFYLPVLIGAYFFGKKYAVISSVFSVSIIYLMAYFSPHSFTPQEAGSAEFFKWFDLLTWGVILVITGYCMGILYDKKEKSKKELQRTYSGIIEMLSLVIASADNYTQSHSHRVSVIAQMIAKQMKLDPIEVENIRVAALLHDLGKVGVSEAILQKVTALNDTEKVIVKKHTWMAINLLEPLGETVTDILPMILHHHEKYNGTGYNEAQKDEIPRGAKIIAVADVYDALTTDRPYRKAFSPLQAKQEILANAGIDFDPKVVEAFNQIFPYIEADRFLSNSA